MAIVATNCTLSIIRVSARAGVVAVPAAARPLIPSGGVVQCLEDDELVFIKLKLRLAYPTCNRARRAESSCLRLCIPVLGNTVEPYPTITRASKYWVDIRGIINARLWWPGVINARLSWCL